MREKYVFSNGQDLSTLNGTGVVSSNVFNLEEDAESGNTIITNDQIEAYLNLIILATTNTGGDEGLDIELRANDNADMTTGTPEYLGTLKILQSEIVAGAKFSIKVNKSLSQKFLGCWYKAVSSALTGATTIDCWIGAGPLTPNDSIQKVPS